MIICMHIEYVQTKVNVGTLCLHTHHQCFWQLIDQCVLALLSSTVSMRFNESMSEIL